MKQTLLFSLLLLILVGCKSQTNNLNNNMKYFNEKEFRGWRNVDDIFERPDNDRFLKKDNKRVRIIKNEKEITIERTSIDSPYRNVEIYYPNHNIKLWGDEFYSFPIGIWLHYDEIGRKTKEENLDVDYKFSVKDLIQKFQKEYNIDIEDPKNVHYCNRLFPKDIGAIYEIGLNTEEPYVWMYYLINGNTGETLYKLKMDEFSNTSIIKEYKKYLEKQKQEDSTTTTFNGKTYTEEEWKAFEQEQWEKYQAKRSKKGFFD